MRRRPHGGWTLRTVHWAASGRWTRWIRILARGRWKTSWGASLMACIADAVLENLPAALRRRGRARRGSAAVRREVEQPGSSDGVRVHVAGAGGGGDVCPSGAKFAAERFG